MALQGLNDARHWRDRAVAVTGISRLVVSPVGEVAKRTGAALAPGLRRSRLNAKGS